MPAVEAISDPNTIAFDADDTLFMRQGIARLGGFAKGRWGFIKKGFRYNYPPYSIDTIPDIDHTLVNRPTSNRAEEISFQFHRNRVVIPGLVDQLKAKVDAGKKIIIISGRAATCDWYDMTYFQLRRQGIPFYDILLTPDGTPTALSKAHGLLITGASEFSDDDLKTQLILSSTFPKRQFNWIRHGMTNIPVLKKELAKRPNLKEVPLSQWMGR